MNEILKNNFVCFWKQPAAAESNADATAADAAVFYDADAAAAGAPDERHGWHDADAAAAAAAPDERHGWRESARPDGRSDETQQKVKQNHFKITTAEI